MNPQYSVALRTERSSVILSEAQLNTAVQAWAVGLKHPWISWECLKMVYTVYPQMAISMGKMMINQRIYIEVHDFQTNPVR